MDQEPRKLDSESGDALRIMLCARDHGLECGIPPERLAYAAIFTALSDLVILFGEDAVTTLVAGLQHRVQVGEFSALGDSSLH